MGRYIVRLGEYYLEWSTVVDAPITFGMKIDEFKKYYLAEYGHSGMTELPQRLKRADAYGTSSHERVTAASLIEINRAGPDEDELTQDEIYTVYCLQQPIRNGWIVPTD